MFEEFLSLFNEFSALRDKFVNNLQYYIFFAFVLLYIIFPLIGKYIRKFIVWLLRTVWIYLQTHLFEPKKNV